MRKSTINRETAETKISLSLDLDGTGVSSIETGHPFFDHMLTLFSKHSLIDLTISVDGDIEVDAHHTVEDTGIVLGEAIAEALGDFGGITRFGHAYLPMDETLSRAALDLCRRPYFIWNVEFKRDKVGDMDTELFKEFFQAFATRGGMCLHMENLYGENQHHIAESLFKALARALRMAITPDERLAGQVASTKGSL